MLIDFGIRRIMGNSLHTKNINELQESLSTDDTVANIPRIAGILKSKSLKFLADEIGLAKESLSTAVEKLNGTLDRMISSSNKMFRATIITTVVMLLLTAAIAFSALVQAGIILDKGYEDGMEEAKNVIRYKFNANYRNGYEDAMQDNYAYDEGYMDAKDGKLPRHTNDPDHMEGYKDGE